MKSYILLLLVLLPSTYAHDQEHPPTEVGESIVNLDLSCNGLDKKQLLSVGIYLYGDSKYAWWTRLKARAGYCMNLF